MFSFHVSEYLPFIFILLIFSYTLLQSDNSVYDFNSFKSVLVYFITHDVFIYFFCRSLKLCAVLTGIPQEGYILILELRSVNMLCILKDRLLSVRERVYQYGKEEC